MKETKENEANKDEVTGYIHVVHSLHPNRIPRTSKVPQRKTYYYYLLFIISTPFII